jgi:hypothetical protein
VRRACSLTFPSDTEARARSRLVRLAESGRLVYAPLDEWNNRVPDYSFAGYQGGGVALPRVSVKLELTPLSDRRDDTERIQTAIDHVSQLPPDNKGLRGVVLLKAGIYTVAGPLKIQADGVVLRGEGQDEQGGTVIRCSYRSEKAAAWSRDGWPHKLLIVGRMAEPKEIRPRRIEVADEYVPVGSRVLRLKSADGFRPGDTILVKRRFNAHWVQTITLPAYQKDLQRERKPWGGMQGTAETYERTILKIEGDQLTLDLPLYAPLAAAYGGAWVSKAQVPPRTRQVGVENLRLVSLWEPGPDGKDDQRHSPQAVQVAPGVEDFWVDQLTVVDFFGAGMMLYGIRGTVRDSTVLMPDPKYYEGFRYVARYGFSLNNRQLLVIGCRARNCRHGFDSNNHRLGGPRVFLDDTSENDQGGSGAHFGGVAGDLYDNVEQQGLNFLGASSPGAEFRCFQAMFWNCRAKGFVCTQPPPTSPAAGYNWAVGCSLLTSWISVKTAADGAYSAQPASTKDRAAT